MAKQRYLNTKFWTDTYITGLDPIEKLLFLYFITNHLTNISGVYEIQLKQVAFDTGIHLDMVEKIMARFERDKKIVYRSGWVCAVNFVKHQVTNSPQVQAGIIRELKGAPKDLIPYVYGIGTLLNLDLTLTELEPIPEPIPNAEIEPPKNPAEIITPIPLPTSPKQKKLSTSLTEAQKETKQILWSKWQEEYQKHFPIQYKNNGADWKMIYDRGILDIPKEKLIRVIELWFIGFSKISKKYYPPYLRSLAKGWERTGDVEEEIAKSTKSSKDDFKKV